jgi:O-antigen/teichoic acid export membrane protein
LISVTLGPEGLGVTGTIDQFLSVVLVLSSLSLPAIATRLMPRTHGVDPDGFRRQYANFITTVLVASAVGTVIVATVVQTVPRLLGHELAGYRLEITVALASVP